jgi:hypothetical protein
MTRVLGSSFGFWLGCASVGVVCGRGSPARGDLGDDFLAVVAGSADEAIDRQTSGGPLVASALGATSATRGRIRVSDAIWSHVACSRGARASAAGPSARAGSAS